MNVSRRRRTRALLVWLERLLYDEQTQAIARIFRVPLRLLPTRRARRRSRP